MSDKERDSEEDKEERKKEKKERKKEERYFERSIVSSSSAWSSVLVGQPGPLLPGVVKCRGTLYPLAENHKIDMRKTPSDAWTTRSRLFVRNTHSLST